MARFPASLIPAVLCKGSHFGKQLFANILEKIYSRNLSQARENQTFHGWTSNAVRIVNFVASVSDYLICLCDRLFGVASCSEHRETFCTIMTACFLLICHICKVLCAAVSQPQQGWLYETGNPHSTSCCTSPFTALLSYDQRPSAMWSAIEEP